MKKESATHEATINQEPEMTEQAKQEMFAALVNKENNLLLFEKDGQKIFILGTIHHFHFTEANNYSLAHVQSVIKSVAPDILLIEGRPETLEKHDAVDGPFEMLFARKCADELNIPVRGIDWWSPVKTKEEYIALNLERDDKMLDNILTGASGYKRVLALLGASHRERVPERIARKGYAAIDIDDAQCYFQDNSTSFMYPKGLTEEYNRSILFYQSAFSEEVKKNLHPNDELYEMFTAQGKSNEGSSVLLDMIGMNKLFMPNEQ